MTEALKRCWSSFINTMKRIKRKFKEHVAKHKGFYTALAFTLKFVPIIGGALSDTVGKILKIDVSKELPSEDIENIIKHVDDKLISEISNQIADVVRDVLEELELEDVVRDTIKHYVSPELLGELKDIMESLKSFLSDHGISIDKLNKQIDIISKNIEMQTKLMVFPSLIMTAIVSRRIHREENFSRAIREILRLIDEKARLVYPDAPKISDDDTVIEKLSGLIDAILEEEETLRMKRYEKITSELKEYLDSKYTGLGIFITNYIEEVLMLSLIHI